MKIGIIGDGFFAKEIEAYCIGCAIGCPIVGFDISLYSEHTKIILGSGKPPIKKNMLSEINFEPKFISVVVGANYGRVNEGSVIAPGAVVGPHSEIGKHVLINYNATVGHDTFVGDLSVISPNSAVGGNCNIGESVYIGAGSCIKENLIIGQNTVIGMGAVVTKNVPNNSVVVGNPGMVFHRDEWDQIKKQLSKEITIKVDILRNCYE